MNTNGHVEFVKSYTVPVLAVFPLDNGLCARIDDETLTLIGDEIGCVALDDGKEYTGYQAPVWGEYAYRIYALQNKGHFRVTLKYSRSGQRRIFIFRPAGARYCIEVWDLWINE